MEKWQENRNYRKIRDENGTVIANIITVDGRDVAVTEDVFAAYAQMDRRERYLSEDLPTGKVLSMEQMAEDGVLPDYVGAETAPSAEDCVLARESEREREELTSLLLEAPILMGNGVVVVRTNDGRLTGFDGKAVTLDQSVTIELEKAAQIRLHIDF